MPLLNIGDVKSQLKIPSSQDSSDTIIQALMDAVQIVVEEHTGKILAQRSFSYELYQNERTFKIWVQNTPLVSLESITDDRANTSIDISGALIRSNGMILLQQSVQNKYLTINYTSGVADADIPANYKEAALIIAQQLWQTRRGSMPSTAAVLEDSLSKESYRQGFLVGYAIPNAALELLGIRNPVIVV